MGVAIGECVIGERPAARFVLDAGRRADNYGTFFNMNTLSGREVLEAVGGLLTWGGRKVDFKRVCTDSRETLPGDLFVALVGERFDAHDFIPDAIEKGAAGVLYQHGRYQPQPIGETWAIEVPDTLTALGDLAAYYRRKQLARVIGVTGSVGKTTVKTMTAWLLSRFANVTVSPKSYNNAVGVPVTLFQIDSGHDYAVVEMGTNAPGEIRRLAYIALPDVAVITSIEPVHVEGLGGLEGIAREKADILAHMRDPGAFITNGDNPWCRRIAEQFPGPVLTFGRGEECDVRATNAQRLENGVRFVINGETPVTLDGVFGLHNVYNALAAIAVNLHLGRRLDEIAGAFAGFTMPPMRLQLVRVADRLCVLDCYNSNPCSLAAALEEFGSLAGRRPKVAVLGDMAELGDLADEAHAEAGRRVAGLALDGFVAVGPLMARAADAAVEAGMNPDRVWKFPDSAQAAEQADSVLPADAVFLLKASRCVQLERVLERLQSAS